MKKASLHSIRTLNLLIAGLSIGCLVLVFFFVIWSLQSIEKGNSAYESLLVSPRAPAQRVRDLLQQSLKDASEHASTEKLADLFSLSAEIWERDSFQPSTQAWSEKRFALPLYRELVIGKFVEGGCRWEVARNPASEKAYQAQPTNERLFPFDDPCQKLNGHSGYVSDLLSWRVTRAEQMGDSKDIDPINARGKVTFVDGIIRFGTRLGSGKDAKLVLLALDARHLYNAVIHTRIYPQPEVVLPSYTDGSYPFFVDTNGWFMVHPKLWNLPGYLKDSHKQVEAWSREGEQQLPIRFPYVDSTFPPKIDPRTSGAEDVFVLGGKHKDLAIYSYKNVINQVKNRITTPVEVTLPDGEKHYFGTAEVSIQNQDLLRALTEFHGTLENTIARLKRIAMVLIPVVACLFVLLILYSLRRISNPLLRIVAELRGLASAGKISRVDSDPSELKTLTSSINELLSRVQTQAEALLKRSVAEKVADVATQVAHDIRSPLTALSIVSQADEIPAAHRSLMQNAVRRISDIARDLDARNKGKSVRAPIPQRACEIVEQLLAEKTIEHSTKPGIRFEIQIDDTAALSSVAVPAEEFKRVLSNLINNAVESIADNGTVTLRLSATTTQLVLKISDNGRGIPSHRLADVFTRGASFDKPEGSGLGLAYAHERVTHWGGSLTLESVEGAGTTVHILLPNY